MKKEIVRIGKIDLSNTEKFLRKYNLIAKDNLVKDNLMQNGEQKSHEQKNGHGSSKIEVRKITRLESE